MKQIILVLIKIYQNLFSPQRGFFRNLYFVSGNCKFPESCSDYAYRVIKESGALKGSKLALSRLAQCHPFKK